jgi:hypothetical protein
LKKYLRPKEAYVDFLIGEIPENPLDSKGRLLEQYDGNDYSGNPNDWPDLFHEDFCDDGNESNEVEVKYDDYGNAFDPKNGEVFDPGYHEDYFDIDEVNEYGEGAEQDCA